MFTHLLVPVDGSQHADRALDIAIGLAQRDGADLTLIHVMSDAGRDRVPRDLEAFAEIEKVRITEGDLAERVGNEILQRAERRAAEHGLTSVRKVLDRGDPASAIAAYVDANPIDLVVMGRRGLGDFRGLLFGSVSHKVAQATDCSCLTVI